MTPRESKSRTATGPAATRARRAAPGARAPLQALADGAPQALRFGRLQAAADRSPHVVAQARARDEVAASPKQAAQLRLPDAPVQRAAVEEEEPLQGRFPVQRAAVEEEEPLQARSVQRKPEAAPAAAANRTGMPDRLKSGVEALSGLDMSDVRVRTNSSKPAEVGALAYAQGTDIHVGPGQEQHLPHEAWHVVQQRQGRVQPTTQAAGVAINDDPGLEREADVMGGKALTQPPAATPAPG